jgi:hypothetical protein
MNKTPFESNVLEALANAELAARLLLFMAGQVREDPFICGVTPEELSCLFEGLIKNECDFVLSTQNGVHQC